ncbi:putative component of anaerobic dehydrogenase [Desulfitobacterium dichloroeliminans LMG P-21439]|uniref:Putative component of anaerobic dehydrogenase n=1 Tax=Desulfitobacterium dichloroeliminans (strain LMG P-21439 / DCA1) TaxID=871963 RepID=L0FDL3_DESDL|nr:molecular chaperone TorD family protein [Desulfitobacterium dichloroeliminans]AGA70751.1 putative component of anaerobic dehydrogenase [Desulfitobacterium dichloroeliminans LMG P-21439]
MAVSWEEVCSLRSRLYSFLGNCLLEPIQIDNEEIIRGQFWLEFPLDAANLQMQNGLNKLIRCTEELERLSASQAIQEIHFEYTDLFLGPGQPKAPPWESVYRTPEKLVFGGPTLQVRELFRQNGFEFKFKHRMPEDHMGLELIFLASAGDRLCEALTSDSEETSTKAVIESQISFIKDHPLTWIADFSKDASLHGSIGFYPGLIELIWGVLLWDLELLEEMNEETT